jgi:hypothetical protein
LLIHPIVYSSAYLNTSNQRIALVYNAHENQQTITFVMNGKTQNHTIRGLGFETITLT